MIYDLNRVGVEYARLHEHVRQVHRVAFNPHQGALLLSGSQDATVRLWDLRDLAGDRSVATCQSGYQYFGNNEGIRDLRWSPTNGVEFAAGTDNGVIQRWDFRKVKAPILKVNAHEKTCHSIDWHPDGKHLVSGGADKCVNVWDFSSTDRRKKPCWQLRGPQAVLNVRWRPPAWSVDGLHPGNWQYAQLATSYDHHDPRIHVWDFHRQHMPLCEIDRYDTPATSILWHSEDLLWSVGMSGIFTQTDVNFAPKRSDRRSANVLAMAPHVKILFFSERKAPRPRSLQDESDEFYGGRRKTSIGADRLSGSHSATDGSFEETGLLNTAFKSRHRISTNSRSSRRIANTPPSAGSGGSNLKLDETMRKEFIFRPAQAAAHGHIIGVFDAISFAFLAKYYRSSLTKSSAATFEDQARLLATSFQHNAVLAAYTNQYQLAQSWRILSMAVEQESKTWVFTNGADASSASSNLRLEKSINLDEGVNQMSQNDHQDRSAFEASNGRHKLEALHTLENSSNLTTPIARPVSDTEAGSGTLGRTVFADEGEPLALPDSMWGKDLLQPQPNTSIGTSNTIDSWEFRGTAYGTREVSEPIMSPERVQPGLETVERMPSVTGFLDLDHHMDERRAANDSYRVQPRPLLRLEEPMHALRGNFLAPLLGRQDSTESFQLFSASTESSHRLGSAPGSLGSSQGSERLGLTAGTVDGSQPRIAEACPEVTIPNHGQHVFLPEDCQPFPPRFPEHSSQAIAKIFKSSSPGSSPTSRPSNHEPPIVHLDDFDWPQEPINSAKRNNVPAQFGRSFFARGEQEPYTTSLRPWVASSILRPLITYHTAALSSCQLPAHVLLQLGPSLSNSIPPALILCVLLTYHAQLTSLSLFVQAAHLRNLAYPLYPEVSEHGSYGVNPGGPWCTVCKRPSKGDKPRFCERCNHAWADCPICEGGGTASITDNTHLRPSDSLWGWCQWCGHGGHTGCLRVWWELPETSEGGCATAGCLHDCVAGTRREEALKRKTESKKTWAVKGDEWVVRESRAVERARTMVSGMDSGNRGGISQGQMIAKGVGGVPSPLSLGMMGRTGSGGKKVRLLVPAADGEGHVEVDGGGEIGPKSSASAA